MEWNLQQLEPSVLSAQGLQSLPKDLQSPEAPREHYRLLYTVGGSFEVQWEQKIFTVPENCAFLFLPNQLYFTQATQDTLQLIDIQFRLSKKASQSRKPVDEDLELPLSTSTVFKPTAHIKRAIEAVLWEWQKSLLFSHEITDLYCKAILLGLLRTSVEEENALFSDTAEKIMQYVHEHITEGLQNEDAAKALSYHPNYINRVIKRATGMTFHKYVIDEKLTYATSLLLSTNNSITEIAYSLSFNTSSHFSNLFAEKYQCTPSQYRKRRF